MPPTFHRQILAPLTPHPDLLQILPVQESAPYLLGATLQTPLATVQIVEVEAYAGTLDPGSHAYRGQTPRNAAMFGPPAHAYVYFTYGNHWMLNITARPQGEPAAILVRAAIPLTNPEPLYPNRPKAKKDTDLLSGPGKLCAALQIHRDHDKTPLLDPKNSLFLTFPKRPAPEIIVSTRVGLAPGKGDQTPWRFIDPRFPGWASLPRPKP